MERARESVLRAREEEEEANEAREREEGRDAPLELALFARALRLCPERVQVPLVVVALAVLVVVLVGAEHVRVEREQVPAAQAAQLARGGRRRLGRLDGLLLGLLLGHARLLPLGERLLGERRQLGLVELVALRVGEGGWGGARATTTRVWTKAKPREVGE